MKRFLRWCKFNAVGLIGVALQLGLLAIFTRLLRLDYMVATFLAVELTVLHNFAWHRRYTWRERSGDTLAQLLRFNLGNGAVSIVGNLLLMRLFVSGFHAPVLAANFASILVCSTVNFFLSDAWVFAER